jgi:hypothetical protein
MKEAVRSWEVSSQRKTHKRAPHVGRGNLAMIEAARKWQEVNK